MLVLRHQTAFGFFASHAEAASKNKDDPDAPLFSRLDELESMRGSGGKFKFTRCYVGEDVGWECLKITSFYSACPSQPCRELREQLAHYL